MNKYKQSPLTACELLLSHSTKSNQSKIFVVFTYGPSGNYALCIFHLHSCTEVGNSDSVEYVASSPQRKKERDQITESFEHISTLKNTKNYLHPNHSACVDACMKSNMTSRRRQLIICLNSETEDCLPPPEETDAGCVLQSQPF